MAAESGLALIWVHYRTPELLRESIDAARSDLAFSGIMGELVVVENGGLERDPANVTVLRPERNIGYAGGVNLGVAYTSAPNIVVMNPDVLVEPGCIPALLDALADHAIAAPNLFLDRACTFRLPPTEQRDFLSTCVAELGRHHPQWTRYARRRWRRHAHRHWLCPSGTVESHDLSGAMLAFTRKAFETVGPWDEGYQLYFEETDWLTRAANMRQRSAFVAAAMAAHLYAQSTRRESRSAAWFAQSNRRFELKHFRPWQRLVLRLIRARSHGSASIGSSSGSEPPVKPSWFELSVARCGYPAAARWVLQPASLESDSLSGACEQLLDGPCWLRWVDPDGNELSARHLRIERGNVYSDRLVEMR